VTIDRRHRVVSKVRKRSIEKLTTKI
jgi:hypothetical protein